VVGVPELKRCVVCGWDFDASQPDQWACMVAHLGSHVPDDRPGSVYVLHFDAPTMVADADNGHVRPTTHYVGWTGQPVAARVQQHGVPESSIAHTRPGTAQDEALIKGREACPRCGVPLAPECFGGRRNA
jgi:rubredoxin